MIFGLLMIPIALILSVSIDFGRASMMQARLNRLADSAALKESDCLAKNLSTGSCAQDIPPGACTTPKQKNVIVAVVYTTYAPFEGTEQFDKLVGPFASSVAPRL